MSVLNRKDLALAIKDIRDGMGSIYIWPMLGWQDIKQRYRRSVIGPFWLTISYGAMIAGMGPLYGRLLQQNISEYFSYLAISFVVWILLSGIITDTCNAFISAEGTIKQVKLPLTIHVLRVVWRNVIIFLHNSLIVILVMLFYQPAVGWSLLSVPFGVLAIAISGIWIGLLLAILCARFGDVPPVITSFVQVAFFLTPVMWRPEMLGRRQWLTDLNPFFHFLEIVRIPLLGGPPAAFSWAVVLMMIAIGFPLTTLLFSRVRARIAYWV